MKSSSHERSKLLAQAAANSILADDNEGAVRTLQQLLSAKCEFSELDLVGKEIGHVGTGQPQKFFEAFDKIIDKGTMGGFVIVGRALTCFLETDFQGVMQKSREYTIKGDEWYVCDIIGERSLGQALVDHFDETLPWLDAFLRDENKWVRRSAGVAVHFFGKRVVDDPVKTKKLLNLIEPYIEERDIDAVKGIGWGLKTIGRHHPGILVRFLKRQLRSRKRISKLMVRKALTYVDDDTKLEVGKYA